MNNSTQDSLKLFFKSLLEKPDFVCVENFQKEMEKKNNILRWSEKETNLKDFQILLNNWDPIEFELYYEGLRCLTQIHLNLLKDFEIFKIYPIRKYSSAYNYISKIDKHEDILFDMGYEEFNEDKIYKLNQLTNIKNPEKAFDMAYYLLICFMELSELIKVRYAMCEVKDLIALRENCINKQIENDKCKQLTDGEILKFFEKCELCDNDVDQEKKQCSVCEAPIKEFSIAYKFRDFLKKRYDIDVSELPEAPLETPKFDQTEKPFLNKEVGNENWKCDQCTYQNSNNNLNCIICETGRKN